MDKQKLIKLSAIVIACLFVYAAVSKLIDYEQARREMLNQVFPNWLSDILTLLIPTVELILACMLIKDNLRKPALWMSMILLSMFTFYILFILMGVFGRIPCSCGGVLNKMGYGTHLIFNLAFVGIAAFGISLASGRINHN